MSKLIDLLKELGADAALAAEYAKDPHPVIARYDLTEEERKALLAGDVDKLRELAGHDKLHMTNSTIKAFD